MILSLFITFEQFNPTDMWFSTCLMFLNSVSDTVEVPVSANVNCKKTGGKKFPPAKIYCFTVALRLFL